MLIKLTIAQAATVAGVDPTTLRRQITTHQLPAHRHNKTYRIDPYHLRRWASVAGAHIDEQLLARIYEAKAIE